MYNQITVNGARAIEHIAKGKGAVIFFNGTGESKSHWPTTKPPYDALTKHGPAKFLKEGWKPQYVNIYCVQTPTPEPSNDWIDGVVNEIAAKSNVDKERIYLMGLSAGAKAANWYVGSSQDHADKIAAVVTFSGWWPGGISYVKNLPIRFYHGTEDTTVKPDDIEAVYKLMQEAKLPNKELYLKPGTHGTTFWATYFDPQVAVNYRNAYKWAAQFKRGGIKI